MSVPKNTPVRQQLKQDIARAVFKHRSPIAEQACGSPTDLVQDVISELQERGLVHDEAFDDVRPDRLLSSDLAALGSEWDDAMTTYCRTTADPSFEGALVHAREAIALEAEGRLRAYLFQVAHASTHDSPERALGAVLRALKATK